MKRILLMAITLAFSLQSKAQKTDTVKISESTIGRNTPEKAANPLIVIDGNKQYLRGVDVTKLVTPEDIASLNILKDSAAIKKYGINGVIEIKTKTALAGIYNKEIDTGNLEINGEIKNFNFRPSKENNVIVRDLFQRDSDPKARPLYILNGKETENIKAIDSDTIKSVTILKDASATSIYKEKGKNGVIIITTKDTTLTPEKN
ncbi:hypothetical protein [Pedobacter sp. CFBP9032]|uniref:hypothetical protein n=1 Tax=Pedobacter sp. CFBP9032 TaxID=3096539 RepID=UPI002A6AE57C|nr:hypothetical protein [Pedobacter sp. CFBP9032]MDY0905985.1 hypothetical protein [Pedobacter sp. CFBP9032]